MMPPSMPLLPSPANFMNELTFAGIVSDDLSEPPDQTLS